MKYRHGDCGLISIDKLPEGLAPSTKKVLMVGSGGNDHAFNEGTFYPISEIRLPDGGIHIGYFEAVPGSKLLHPDHGEKIDGQILREAPINEGVYQVIKQTEGTHSSMVPVED